MKIEKVVEKFYQGLAERKLYGRKCKECGAIEFPPHYACNTCGYHETEWVELSGKAKLHSIIPPASLSADLWNTETGPYAYGLIELEEGAWLNGVVFGIKKKNVAKLEEMLPLPIHPKLVDKEDYTTLYFELDDVEIK